MTAKKSYNRFFIIFQEEDKGYGMGPDRPPTGYAKVETRNDKSKVTVYVQNLKPFESGDFLYKCYLISHQDNKDCTAYLGMMNIDDLGRGESSWETNADNAFDSKTTIEKFNGAAVVVENGGLTGIIAPLAGYMSKEKFDWRSKINIVKESSQILKGEMHHEGTEVKEIQKSKEELKFKEYENNIVADESIKAVDSSVHDDITNVDLQDINEELIVNEPGAVIDNNGVLAEEIDIEAEKINTTAEELNTETENVDAAIDDVMKVYMTEADPEVENTSQPVYAEREDIDEDRSKHKEHMEHKHEYSGCAGCSSYSYRHIIKKMLEDILADYEKMDKHKDLKECILWKVDMGRYMRDGYKMTMYPCYDLLFYPMMYNPYYNYIRHIRKHGHYIFGMKHDKDGKVTALIYGIPGKREPHDQPMAGTTGFTKWIPFNSQHGYWIMMYDPMTGIIINIK